MKDLHAGTTPNTRKILNHVMDGIALVANANFKLNMKRGELIKPELNPPYQGYGKMKLSPQPSYLETTWLRQRKQAGKCRKLLRFERPVMVIQRQEGRNFAVHILNLMTEHLVRKHLSSVLF